MNLRATFVLAFITSIVFLFMGQIIVVNIKCADLIEISSCGYTVKYRDGASIISMYKGKDLAAIKIKCLFRLKGKDQTIYKFYNNDGQVIATLNETSNIWIAESEEQKRKAKGLYKIFKQGEQELSKKIKKEF